MDKDPAKELPFNGVYHYKDGKLTLVIRDLTLPNGIALLPDEKTLYVDNSGPDMKYMKYPVLVDGTCRPRNADVARFEPSPEHGVPDGMKLDSHGNIWGSSPGGIRIFTPKAKSSARSNSPRSPPTSPGATTAKPSTSPPRTRSTNSAPASWETSRSTGSHTRSLLPLPLLSCFSCCHPRRGSAFAFASAVAFAFAFAFLVVHPRRGSAFALPLPLPFLAFAFCLYPCLSRCHPRSRRTPGQLAGWGEQGSAFAFPFAISLLNSVIWTRLPINSL